MASIIRLCLHTTSRFTFIWVAFLMSSLAVMATTYHKPNIVLILTDDLDLAIGGMVSFCRLCFINFHVNLVNDAFGACVMLLFLSVFTDSLKQNKEVDWGCRNNLYKHGVCVCMCGNV